MRTRSLSPSFLSFLALEDRHLFTSLMDQKLLQATAGNLATTKNSFVKRFLFVGIRWLVGRGGGEPWRGVMCLLGFPARRETKTCRSIERFRFLLDVNDRTGRRFVVVVGLAGDFANVTFHQLEISIEFLRKGVSRLVRIVRRF